MKVYERTYILYIIYYSIKAFEHFGSRFQGFTIDRCYRQAFFRQRSHLRVLCIDITAYSMFGSKSLTNSTLLR